MLKRTLVFFAVVSQVILDGVLDPCLIALWSNIAPAPTITEANVTFLAYTKNNANNPTELKIGETPTLSLAPTTTVIIIHGYIQSTNADWIIAMRKAFLQYLGFNVITVDWSGPANSIYPIAANYTRDVGRMVANLIISLNISYNVDYSDIHMLGHSLGAHICGIAGTIINTLKSVLVRRITGLDPAGPCFCYQLLSTGLNKTCALFVDCIYTDENVFGCPLSLGHAVFKPNGGRSPQPGCPPDSTNVTTISAILTNSAILTPTIKNNIFCSHKRATLLFNETINNLTTCKFIGKKCVNSFFGECLEYKYEYMGEYVNTTSARGIYYLETNGASPYAKC